MKVSCLNQQILSVTSSLRENNWAAQTTPSQPPPHYVLILFRPHYVGTKAPTHRGLKAQNMDQG